MRGLGDLVKRITDATGISPLVKAVFGEDCGCDERQELMNNPNWLVNKLFTSNKGEDLEEKAKVLAFVIKLRKQGKLSPLEVGLMWDSYRMYVNPRKKNTNCSKCVIAALKELQTKLEG